MNRNFFLRHLLAGWLLLTSSMVLSNQTEENTILVFGDSLSAAYGIRTDRGWVSLLSERMASQYPSYRVVNASISGETTGGGLKRFPEALARYSPKVVILELGANDGLRGFPVKIIRQNLSAMIELAQSRGARVLLTGIHLPPNFGPAYSEQFYRLFGDLANRYGIASVPFLLENVALVPGLLQRDGLHPTEDAQPIILDTVWKHLKPLLTRQ